MNLVGKIIGDGRFRGCLEERLEDRDRNYRLTLEERVKVAQAAVHQRLDALTRVITCTGPTNVIDEGQSVFGMDTSDLQSTCRDATSSLNGRKENT